MKSIQDMIDESLRDIVIPGFNSAPKEREKTAEEIADAIMRGQIEDRRNQYAGIPLPGMASSPYFGTYRDPSPIGEEHMYSRDPLVIQLILDGRVIREVAVDAVTREITNKAGIIPER